MAELTTKGVVTIANFNVSLRKFLGPIFLGLTN